jgi:transposase
MEASLLRLGLDTALRRGGHALASTDRVAVSIHRCCPAQLAGTEDVTAKVFGTVTRTTDWVSVAIQFDPATGGGADDLSRSIRLAGRIGLGTNHRSRTIEANVPSDLDVHLVMDNYGTHKTPSIKAWFARHPRFHVHFTPTSASWLNQVERWFATLTEKYIRRGTHRSTRQLEQAIKQYLQINNANPKPFTWVKSADDILASIERFCLRISNSGH